MPPHRRLPDPLRASASSRVRALLATTEHQVPVVHRGLDAVYLDLRDLDTPLAVLGVLSAAATVVPCGLATTVDHLPDHVLDLDVATLGDGLVRLGGTEVTCVRTVDVSVPRLPATEVARASALLDDATASRLDQVRAELPEHALRSLVRADADAVPHLLGRGSGLTPVGDDVLCGWAAIATATGSTQTPLGDAVRRLAPAATTSLSSTLLDCALRGEVLPEFRLLVLDLADPGVRDVGSRVDALLRVGHTSGAGLLLGATLALHHLRTDPTATPAAVPTAVPTARSLT